GDVPLQIAAQYYLAAASDLSGDYRATERVSRNLMQSLHDQRPREGFGLATFPAVYTRAVLARVLAERGVFDEGDTHGQEAIRIAEALDHPFSVVVGCLDLAYLKSVRGELSQAAGLVERACADRAVTLARGRGERGNEAWALRLLGEIASHPGRPDVATAAAHYGAAMTLASELGMRPLVAHCHLGLGKLYRRTGQREQAQE